MSTIELYNGQVTNKEGTFSIWTFVRSQASSKDVPIMEAAKDPRSGVTEPGGIVESVPSSKGTRVPGSWTKRRIECENGTLLKFHMRRSSSKKQFAGGARQSMAAFWIRSRDTAPLREISIELPTDHFSTMSRLYITGRFDMIEPKELVDLKLHLTDNTNDLMLFNPAHYEEYIQERVIEEAIAPRSKVVLKQEGSKTISRPMRSRRIRPVSR